MRTKLDPALPSPLLLAAAPHRLLFFIGAVNVLAAMAWWTLWLIEARWQSIGLPQPPIYAGQLHAIVLQYQVLPPFIFGFLLTVFPRWTNQKAFGRLRYLLVGGGLLLGQALTWIGLLGPKAFLQAGAWLCLFGWGVGLLSLFGIVVRDRARNEHAVSSALAMSLGFVGLALYAVSLYTTSPWPIFVAIKTGTFGLLLPIYFTVAHRMFPFFARNVVEGYVPWRPRWVLVAFWPFALLHLGLEIASELAWLWVADLPLLSLSLLFLWRNWPRKKAPPLLRVLFYGYVWLPVAMALYLAQSIKVLLTGAALLGRAPAHALFVGFFGSLLVAMVTRVTQGHSGRPLVLGKLLAFAFITIQLVAILRIGAEFKKDFWAWQAIAAAGWILAFLPWVLRSAYIYLTPRVDGKPG